MNFGNGFLDILLFAVIAGVLLFRLRSVLGERKEEDLPSFPPVKMSTDTASDGKPLVEDTVRAMVPNWTTSLPNFDWVATATAHHQLIPFATMDPQFHPADFLDKAKKAFLIILTAYNEGNKKTLEFLLTPELFKAFADQIDQRTAAHETYQAIVHSLKKAEISASRIDGTSGDITVDFIAEQSVTHRTPAGDFVGDGDGRRRTTRDRWTFTRDLRGLETVWRLSRSEDMD